MSKIGRNDPCPCGSGKKYKKCCGGNNVIEFNPSLYNNELALVNNDLMSFAVSDFESELMEYSNDCAVSYLNGADKDKYHTYITLLSAWTILKKQMKNGKTIFDMFYAKQKSKLHPRTRKVLSSWINVKPGVFEIISMNEAPEPKMTLHDIHTNKTYQCLRGNETEKDIGSLAIGVLVPYVGTHDFLFGMVQISKKRKERIFDLLDKIKINKEELDNIYPKFLAETIQPQEENSLEWLDPYHEMVAQLFEEHMMKKEFDDKLIQTGVLLWNVYCHRKNPTVKKPGAYAAALDYMIQLTFVEGSGITQAQAAKEYDTSSGTVSANYRKIADELEDQINGYHLMNGDADSQTAHEIASARNSNPEITS